MPASSLEKILKLEPPFILLCEQIQYQGRIQETLRGGGGGGGAISSGHKYPV